MGDDEGVRVVVLLPTSEDERDEGKGGISNYGGLGLL